MFSMQTLSDLIPFHLSPKAEGSLKNRCYTLWLDVWQSTFQELNVEKNLSADDFLDRHIYGLKTFEGDVCGFMLIRSFTSNALNLEHSYFANYPATLKTELAKMEEHIQVISYMTIASGWRKNNTDLPLSEILMGLCVLHFINSDAKKLWGYFRNNRKTQDIFYRHGGVSTIKNHFAYNVLVDISYMDQKTAQLSSWNDCKIQTLKFWTQLKQGEKNEQPYERQLGLSTPERTV